jgi:hypothetical protein
MVAAERVLVVPGGARVLLHVARVALKTPHAARRPWTRIHLAQHAPGGGCLLRHLQGAAAAQNQLYGAAFFRHLRTRLILQTFFRPTVVVLLIRTQIDTSLRRRAPKGACATHPTTLNIDTVTQ